jgi:SAM-dependent methyltransferase
MTHNHSYLQPQITIHNLDRHIMRRSILNAVQDTIPHFHGIFLDVGSGHQPYRSLIETSEGRLHYYIALDIRSKYNQFPPDIFWDGLHMGLSTGSVDCAMATEVFEHCPDIQSVLAEIYRVLKPGGMLFFTVPFLWTLHDVPYDEYRYTPFALERHLQAAGYEQISLKATGGWDKSMAQMIGLWVRRRWSYIEFKKPRDSILYRVLPRILLPFIWFLDKIDTKPAQFGEGLMITGVTGVAYKPLSERDGDAR